MFGKQLPVPPQAENNPDAFEMLRVFYEKDKGNVFVARMMYWEKLMGAFSASGPNPASIVNTNHRETFCWALLIADLIGHVTNAMQANGQSADVTLDLLMNAIISDVKRGQNITGVMEKPKDTGEQDGW